MCVHVFGRYSGVYVRMSVCVLCIMNFSNASRNVHNNNMFPSD